MLTRSYEETVALGRNTAKTLKDGDVVLLIGDLGAGKTAFSSGVAEGLGVDEYVTSPTFTLMNIYDRADGGKLYHFDLYRMNDAEEVICSGFDEIFGGDGICLVEWPDVADGFFGNRTVEVRIRSVGDDLRDIEIVYKTNDEREK